MIDVYKKVINIFLFLLILWYVKLKFWIKIIGYLKGNNINIIVGSVC